ncbi:B-cell receptor CD22-like [Triplophysa rosa]|uniref:B-cell receptor CD22-like n=1 Tax=Triplophysa rosa TaxID=992332 RepID=UPI002545C6EC|nr:B-cell receptor CD22-like [Triplophysa rosa]
MARLHPLIVLLMIPGVCGQSGWVVTYSSSHICALKGSTVTINCTYTYPTGHKINIVFWTNTIVRPTNQDFPDLSGDSEYRQRIRYLGNKQHDCSVRLTDVRHTDSHEYYFRFITDKPEGKWIGRPGATLAVTDKLVISFSSSCVIVEGGSVTLTCSSESNPPANISWFKEVTFVGSGNIYIISNIRSDHSGQYKCKTRHSCGEKYSDSVTLNVLYPPRNVSASISSSGEIVEGGSVTLTCSSESNPPANISWFKEGTSVGSGNIYIISNIRSDHSGQYKCKARNEHGQKYSAVTLNVLYPPKNVSASIRSSGVIVEGDSVNLTCSSESNPPVHIYSWFKENQTSSVGSGQSFRAPESGWFYCLAQNAVGSQRSAAASVTVHHSSYRHLLFGITAAFGGLLVIAIIIVLIWFMMRNRRVAKPEEAAVNQVNQQDDLYCVVKHVDLASESTHCDDVQYESVKPQRLRGEQTAAGEASESRHPEELHYATVRYKNTEMRRSEENENHYGNITNDKPDASVRSNVEDTSVIYSSVR